MVVVATIAGIGCAGGGCAGADCVGADCPGKDCAGVDCACLISCDGPRDNTCGGLKTGGCGGCGGARSGPGV